ncbi:hypothetical protein EVAR_16222_1 [Eumeta japonica]|uniref:Uncharacterized protein n=1 Tax=Eumeta variegata TaxID=151549 RepID=A0A4C1U5P6_EUMVA|nr:hypothetical protein EVAR_16222_1 [Eumeta japonica]
MFHVLWSYLLYNDIRNAMLSEIEVINVVPAHYADPVGTRANFRRTKKKRTRNTCKRYEEATGLDLSAAIGGIAQMTRRGQRGHRRRQRRQIHFEPFFAVNVMCIFSFYKAVHETPDPKFGPEITVGFSVTGINARLTSSC